MVIWHDAREMFAPVSPIGVQTLVLGALAMLGALGLVFVTTRSVIAPVQMLTDATQKIRECNSTHQLCNSLSPLWPIAGGEIQSSPR